GRRRSPSGRAPGPATGSPRSSGSSRTPTSSRSPAAFPTRARSRSRASPSSSAFQYAPTNGLEGTRDAVGARLDRRPEDGELMITSGGIEALELVAKSFLDRGDDVVVEAPTYLGAIMAFRSFEANVHALPQESLADAPVRPKLLYTIPDHQNPS